MAKNLVFHKKIKYIELRHHYIRNLVQEGEIQLEFVNTKEQLGDIFIKVIIVEKFEQFRINFKMTN